MAMTVLPVPPVADDELALAAADGNHRVDGLDAGMKRHVHRRAVHYAVGGALDGLECCLPPLSGPCRR